MHKSFFTSPLIAFLLLALPTACGTGSDNAKGPAPSAGKKPAAPTPAAETPAPRDESSQWKGKILETMDSGGYSYVHLDTGAKNIWVAGPQTSGLAVGQDVTVPKGTVMNNFHSRTLQRDFPEIYFVTAIHGGGEAAAAAAAGKAKEDTGKIEGVAKVEGGYTVEEIFKKSKELSGKTVKVRGKVVKFSAKIMGTNWFHIQDGSGSGDTSDLTVTANSALQVGDLVVVEGPLSVDKDFGAGYKYSAIIEGAKVTKEQ